MTGSATYDALSTYEHARNGGAIPTATWNANSTCLVTGIVDTLPSGLGQTFGHLTWNNTGQTTSAELTSPLAVAGNLNIQSTGTGEFSILTGATNQIMGNLNLSGGALNMTSSMISNGTINLSGNFNQSGGLITETSASLVGNIFFNGFAVQTFSKTGGAISNTVNFTVNNGATLDFGTSVLDGSAGSFTLSSGAKIITSNDNGLGALGSLQNTGAKSLSSNATYEFRGAATGVFTPSTANTIANLIINSATGLALSMPLTITDDCTFTDGILTTTSTNLLTFNDGATATGADDDSFVDGPVQKIGDEAFTFPIGKTAIGYAPIGISDSELPAIPTDAFQAEYFSATPMNGALSGGIDHISSLEYWTLSRSNGTTNNVRVTLSWRTSSAVTDESALLIARFDGTNWINHIATATGDPNGGTITTNNALSSFSPFTLASSQPLPTNPLPVELLYFNANPLENSVLVNWSTATESNNAYFIVEKTKDGATFEEVIKLDGAGNSSAVLTYQAEDRRPYSGTSYYRLKQVDFDGRFSYSDLVQVTLANEGFTWDVFPNPVETRVINIALSAPVEAEIEWQLADAMGKIHFRSKLTGNQLILPTNMASGVYLLSATSGGEVIGHKKLIIK